MHGGRCARGERGGGHWRRPFGHGILPTPHGIAARLVLEVWRRGVHRGRIVVGGVLAGGMIRMRRTLQDAGAVIPLVGSGGGVAKRK